MFRNLSPLPRLPRPLATLRTTRRLLIFRSPTLWTRTNRLQTIRHMAWRSNSMAIPQSRQPKQQDVDQILIHSIHLMINLKNCIRSEASKMHTPYPWMTQVIQVMARETSKLARIWQLHRHTRIASPGIILGLLKWPKPSCRELTPATITRQGIEPCTNHSGMKKASTEGTSFCTGYCWQPKSPQSSPDLVQSVFAKHTAKQIFVNP